MHILQAAANSTTTRCYGRNRVIANFIREAFTKGGGGAREKGEGTSTSIIDTTRRNHDLTPGRGQTPILCLNGGDGGNNKWAGQVSRFYPTTSSIRYYSTYTITSRAPILFLSHENTSYHHGVARSHKVRGARELSSSSSTTTQQVKQRRPASKLILGRHVREALANGSPIVALESTVITHGLPEPQNYDLALALESIISSSNCHPVSGFAANTEQHHYLRLPAEGHQPHDRNHQYSATPATVGIVRGQLIVGLSRDEIKYLAQKDVSKPIKASRRDIPIAMGLSLSAGTTVSATMAIASSVMATSGGSSVSDQYRPHHHQAPHSSSSSSSAIKVFATGGLGGVHQGGQLSMDISADLYEFARSPIGVVSSGFKSFLDTRRSLEFLETMGATVMSLQEAQEEEKDGGGGFFPGFFRRKNKENIKSPCIVNSIEEAAQVLLECLEGPVNGPRGFLLAVPIPRRCSWSTSSPSDSTSPVSPLCSTSSTPNSMHYQEQQREREHYKYSQAPPLMDTSSCEVDGKKTSHQQQQQRQQKHYDDDEEQDEDEEEDEDRLLDRALAEISDEIDKRSDLAGKEKTPLILERLERLTGGKSLRANIELLRNNARVGAKLAIKYAQLTNRTGAILEPAPSGQGEGKISSVYHNAAGEMDAEGDCFSSSYRSDRAPTGRRSTSSSSNIQDHGGNTHPEKREAPPKAVAAQEEEEGEDSQSERRTDYGPVVVGCTMIDMHVSTKIDDQFKNNPHRSGITYHGSPHLTLGGVGQNLALALELLGNSPTFITSLGNDNLASFALDQLRRRSPNLVGGGGSVSRSSDNGCCAAAADEQRLVLVSGKPIRQQPTSGSTFDAAATNEQQQPKHSSSCSSAAPSCFALVLMDSTDGQCEYVVANLEAAKTISVEAIKSNEHKIVRAPLLVMDANLETQTIELLIDLCARHRVPVFIEPTDKMALPNLVRALKRTRRENPLALSSLLCLSPNMIELEAMISLFEQQQQQDQLENGSCDSNSTNSAEVRGGSGADKQKLGLEQMVMQLMRVHLPELKCLLVTIDKRGVLVAVRRRGKSGQLVTGGFDGSDADTTLDQIRLLEEFRSEQTTFASSHSQATKEKPPVGEQARDDDFILVRQMPPPRLVNKPISASGAGDSFAAGFINGLLANHSLDKCLSLAFEASLTALEDRNTISDKLRHLAANRRN